MIKINRGACPPELTPEVQRDKTALFKLDGSEVWDEKYIKDGLLNMSHGKCCYCECDVTKESNYVEVEHFHHKDKYKDEVVLWSNLLPSCKKCNCTKNNHDTIAEPIIDPSIDNPQDHMKIVNSVRFRGKTEKGRTTVTTLNLNDQDRHCKPRYEVVNSLTDKLEELKEKFDDIKDAPPRTRAKMNNLRNAINDLLEQCQEDKQYSAVKLTALLNDQYYIEISQWLKNNGYWTNDMTVLETNILPRKYDTV